MAEHLHPPAPTSPGIGALGPFGGQALIEGVMIRGTRSMALALRTPEGHVLTESRVIERDSAGDLRKLPLVRGIIALCDTFGLGIRALYRSARVAQGHRSQRATRADIAFASVVIAVATVIFFTGPVLMTAWIGASGSDWLEVIAEGALRLGMLIGYVWFIGRLPEVQRVFAYHGAEHRTVHAYEHGLTLTPDAVRAFPNAHPRCGTAFLLTVAALSFVAFLALGTPSLPERILERVLLTPLIAAVAYEGLHASQRFEHHPLVRILIRPSLWLQRWTTRDPDDGQIEVAIAAMQAAIAAEQAALAGSAPLLAEADVAITAPDATLDT